MQNLEIEEIPSVFESNSLNLRFVSADLIHGLKIFEGEQGYIVGDLALSEGVSPHRNINSAPGELDYNLLMKSALLLGYQKIGNPIELTTGFPFSTYGIYKDIATENLAGEQEVEYDTATFSKGGKKKINVEIEKANVMPEVVGCALGLRKTQQVNGNFFMLSLGYGTMEAIFSKPSGIVQRSSLSTFGMRYAVNLLRSELEKTYYLDLKNEHQLDMAFREGSIVLNRRRIDLTEVRTKVIRQYYEDVISPGLRKAFDDNDFGRSQGLYLAGGGAMYQDILDCFHKEFEDIIKVEVAKNAQHLAAIGYCYNSLMSNGGDESRAIGIDVGNASTIICTMTNDGE
ncbi:ParM/StbA family protein [Flagellimonas marinaquae]